MKKLWLFIAISFFATSKLYAQDTYVCRDAYISFFSSAPIEDIEAQTDSAFSTINMQTGAVYFKVLIRTFQFERALMQQHFNSHYLQSDLYPYAEFEGNILNFTPPDSVGIYPVTVEGKLTVHGVTKTYNTSGTVELKAEELGVTSTFKIRLADHHIKIPKLLIKNIAEAVDVKISAVYDRQK